MTPRLVGGVDERGTCAPMSAPMSPDDSTSSSPPNIEPSPNPAPPETVGTVLRLRIRQQEILSELGVVALQRVSLQELLDSAVRMAAEGLESEFCKVLEFIPSENRLL